MTAVLGIASPVLAAVIISARPSPDAYLTPRQAVNNLTATDKLVLDLTTTGGALAGIYLRTHNSPQLLLVPREDALAPELLVYWSPGQAASDTLPTDAVYLGRLEQGFNTRLGIPPQAQETEGSLIIYSLLEGQVHAIHAIPKLP